MEQEQNWREEYENSLNNIPYNLGNIASLFVNLKQERDLLYLIITQLLVDSGRYDVVFTDNDFKALENINILMQTIEDGQFKLSLVFPEQKV